MTWAEERRGVGPRQERRAVELPVNGSALTGDGEMVGAAHLDRRGLSWSPGSCGLDRFVVLAQPADDAVAVVPSAQNDDVASWVVASLVRVEGLAIAVELDLDVAGRAFRHDVKLDDDITGQLATQPQGMIVGARRVQPSTCDAVGAPAGV